jgi:OmcA/MtrC family decaheme c-type cytochrome
MCHNPNNTDVAQRPKTAIANTASPQPGEGLPDASAAVDGKKEESIDFKRLIHAIHANAEREKGIVIYGFGGNANDFGEVEFPGIVSDCQTCHVNNPADTMTLEDRSGSGGGNWEQPAQNGILGSVIDSSPNITGATTGGSATGPGSLDYELRLRADDLKISPTAAVCSACHDNAVVQAHMENLGSALFGVNQAAIDPNIEQCVVCHGPGALADVEEVHHEATERAKQGL